MQRIEYGVAQQRAGEPAIALRRGDGGHALGGDRIKGPVSMPAPSYLPLAKNNKVQGDVEALLDVDASGSVAGVREIYSSSVSPTSRGTAQKVQIIEGRCNRIWKRLT